MGDTVTGLHHLETESMGKVKCFVYGTHDMGNRVYINQ